MMNELRLVLLFGLGANLAGCSTPAPAETSPEAVAAPIIDSVESLPRPVPPPVVHGPEGGALVLDRTILGIETASARLMDRADAMSLWSDVAPSSNSHRLLACGAECRTSDGRHSLVDAWLSSSLDRRGMHALHRGELLSVLADVDVPQSRPIRLDEGLEAPLSEVLDETIAATLGSPVEPWNRREAGRGTEYGWLVQAACRYRGASMGRPAAEAEALLRGTIEAAARASTEGGTHELEGLATCASIQRHEPAPGLEVVYAEVEQALHRARREHTAGMRDDGQLYAEDETFDDCSGPVCRTLAELNRQAHFFEWAALDPGLELDAAMMVALGRMEALSERAARLVEDTETDAAAGPPRWLPLLASAATHSAHVARHMRRWRRDPAS